MTIEYKKEKAFLGNTHYCPGCGHGIIHRILGRVTEDLEIDKKTIMVDSVGCSVLIHNYLDYDHIEAAHGRAPAKATGVKRLNPEKIVLTYQGDGDLAAIGGNEILGAANRGENITVIFVNNAIYGMTGGQMAPTSLEGQITTTSPSGRDIYDTGSPLKICELLDTLEAPAYLERTSIHNTGNILKTEKAIKRALQTQMDGKGFSLVEILSNCPIGWKMTPEESMSFIKNEMEKKFPLKKFRDGKK